MKKNNPNTIKLNIVAMILSLICISCGINKTDPQLQGHTDSKENTQNLTNESQILEALYKDLESKDPTTQLTTIGKILEIQKEQENTQIPKIASQNLDFLATFKIDSHDNISEDDQMKIKRIMYSSLNYETSKIAILKEILEKLIKNDQHKEIVRKLLYYAAMGIELELNKNLQSIKTKELNALEPKEFNLILTFAKEDLKKTQRFAKTLNETIEAYSQDQQGIKTDDAKLANYINKNFETFFPKMPHN
ncbi:complement regulator-acquiring protein (plasmid) [Borreliella sinica]|uniref:complement regulator-acquiring protein n=1 Tax=Borreliella sinica TaxID=87162 RepID=UPI002A24CD13|nr:complement regulator-acquiring protein [Borreliella sinica]WPM06425.1 complement regulator-acquiring protein [Borreliella sinica]